MAPTESTRGDATSATGDWYALDPAEVAAQLGVVVDSGLSAAEASARLERGRPERPPGGAASVAAAAIARPVRGLHAAHPIRGGDGFLAVKEWNTAIVLLVITLSTPWSGYDRKEGRRAMNALQTIMKATARVHHDSAESVIRRSSWWPASGAHHRR